MYRAYIAQHKYRVVLDGIAENASTPTGLKAIRKVADYFNSIGDNRWFATQFRLYFFLLNYKTYRVSEYYSLRIAEKFK